VTGNKFAGEICAYCCIRPSTSDDHVFARKFFVEAQRGNLPQVPACEECNREKNRLESELMVVLGFAGRHADATDTLSRLVADRFINKANARIARGVQAGKSTVWAVENGIMRRGMSVPVDWGKVERLFAYIARGLAWLHFDKLQLGEDCTVGSVSLVGEDGRRFRHILGLNARRRVDESVGQGTFHYRGAQATDNPLITFWEFSVYGIRTSSSGDASHNVGVMTGPKQIVDRGRRTRDLLIQWRTGTRLHRRIDAMHKRDADLIKKAKGLRS
jgi:hypothetical protein